MPILHPTINETYDNFHMIPLHLMYLIELLCDFCHNFMSFLAEVHVIPVITTPFIQHVKTVISIC